MADLIVRRDLMDLKQRLGVVLAQSLVQAALVFQKQRTLHEKHREGAQPGVHQRVARVLPPARIGKLLEGPADLFRHVVQRQSGATKQYAHQATTSQGGLLCESSLK
ncbi:MAG: hypothetical protein P9F75_13675 [Candidatus Contendobacter sp.]|nr:hypothetical protein [Candidatus Contendobacter sp.]